MSLTYLNPTLGWEIQKRYGKQMRRTRGERTSVYNIYKDHTTWYTHMSCVCFGQVVVMCSLTFLPSGNSLPSGNKGYLKETIVIKGWMTEGGSVLSFFLVFLEIFCGRLNLWPRGLAASNSLADSRIWSPNFCRMNYFFPFLRESESENEKKEDIGFKCSWHIPTPYFWWPPLMLNILLWKRERKKLRWILSSILPEKVLLQICKSPNFFDCYCKSNILVRTFRVESLTLW